MLLFSSIHNKCRGKPGTGFKEYRQRFLEEKNAGLARLGLLETFSCFSFFGESPGSAPPPPGPGTGPPHKIRIKRL